LLVEHGAIIVGLLESRIEAERGVVIVERRAEFALELVGVAAVGEKVGPLLHPDRLVVVGDRVVVLLQIGIGQPAIVIIFGHLGIEPDRLVGIGKRLVELAELLVGGAAVGESARPVRIEPQRFVGIIDGLLVLAAEIIGHAAVGPGLDVVGLELDHLVIV